MPARDEGREVETRPPQALIAPTQRGEFGSFRERERARERRVFAAAKLVCLSIALTGVREACGRGRKQLQKDVLFKWHI